MRFNPSYITLCSNPKVFGPCRKRNVKKQRTVTHVKSTYNNNKAFKICTLFYITCGTTLLRFVKDTSYYIIYNKPTRCKSGNIVFIQNYKYALHV